MGSSTTAAKRADVWTGNDSYVQPIAVIKRTGTNGGSTESETGTREKCPELTPACFFRGGRRSMNLSVPFLHPVPKTLRRLLAQVAESKGT